MLAQQRGDSSRPGRGLPKLRQTQLPLEIISKGSFDKSEPTIHKGEDLDVPTYIRRGPYSGGSLKMTGECQARLQGSYEQPGHGKLFHFPSVQKLCSDPVHRIGDNLN